MDLKEKFLPIGSIVLLEGDTKKLMITGFCTVSEDDESKIYDYSGCSYPEGYLSSEQIYLFNHNQIKQLLFLGYQSEEETKFKNILNDIVSRNDFDEDDSDDEEYEEDVEDDEEIEVLEHL